MYSADYNVDFIRLEGVTEENAKKEEPGEEKHQWENGRGSG